MYALRSALRPVDTYCELDMYGMRDAPKQRTALKNHIANEGSHTFELIGSSEESIAR